MDEDNQQQHSTLNLPNTPRVSEKILEYYKKFGQERNLEKFMRLYSPASSQDSEKNEGNNSTSTKILACKQTKSQKPVFSNNSREIIAMMPSRPLKVCCESNSKSLPNIDIQGKRFVEDLYTPSDDVAVEINIETDGEKEKILSISTENLKTPKKTFRSTKTQTPESVAKTHRRLEWDSLGDVGYKKSMSASNISIIERSLLREFFKEKCAVSEPPATAGKNLKTIEHSTPPLACSTLVNPTENETKPKMLSHSTSSTTLNEKFEKYAQTSIIKPPTVRSQEIQCTLSSACSIAEGTATPSSFEYYSSRSSKSSDNQNRLQPQEHPFIASITDLLMKRRALGEKNHQQKRRQLNDIKDLQTKFQAALDENKENQSHKTVDSSSATSFSLRKHAPELDLGIQLICALIDAKSINGRQKKQLIRDIIKRLTRIEGEEKSEISTTATSSAASANGSSSNFHHHHHQNVYDSVRSSSYENAIKSLEVGVSPLETEQMHSKHIADPSSLNTNEDGSDVLTAKRPENKSISRKQQHKDKSSCEQYFPLEQTHAQENSKVRNAAARKINKETQSESNMREENRCENQHTEKNCKLKPVPALEKVNRCTQTSKASSLTPPSTASTTSDVMTQKLNKSFAGPEHKNPNPDAEQPTMREWLNPLTQSEIEYEEKKKQIEMRKKAAAQQEKLMKKAKHDCGRVQQLSWIESEIRRLECLKHLLLKDETSTNTTTSASSAANSLHKNSAKNYLPTDKLYDTVCTDKSSVLSESAEQLVHEIEIILEESHEDVVNVKNNFQRSKDRKKETHLIYGKEKHSLKATEANPKLRIMNENTNIHEEQLFSHKPSEKGNEIQKQREKIATPSTDTSKEESDTLKDMVQQRKREFMAAYKSKKQHHYDALKQQQREDFKYRNLPHKNSAKAATLAYSEHYSVPEYNTIPRPYMSNGVSYYTQHPPHAAPTEKLAKSKHTSQPQGSKMQIKQAVISKSANADNSTTNSSSSIFCMSSEISVPMGSQNATSSTSTSAHPHNDRATSVAKVGVTAQTSDSLRRSKPIYGPAPLHPTSVPHNPTAFSSTACIQVKPKGIAYVIEFDESKQTSETDASSNDLLIKPSATSDRSSAFPKAQNNNLKLSLANDQQLLTLQQHLEKRKPKFLKHSRERKAILNQLRSMRQERVRQLREIIENTSLNSLDRRLQYLPPPPIQKVRILRSREMKALTNKRIATLPEVVARQEREIEEKKRRSNRILRDVFNKRLQRRVRSGKLSLNHSKTVV